MAYTLSDLTPGERWWLARRRAEYAQHKVAERLGVRQHLVRAWETDAAVPVPPLPAWLARALPPGALGPAWSARLARRRSGIHLAALAERLGVSRVTVLARELRGTLTPYWDRQGWPTVRARTDARARQPSGRL